MIFNNVLFIILSVTSPSQLPITITSLSQLHPYPDYIPFTFTYESQLHPVFVDAKWQFWCEILVKIFFFFSNFRLLSFKEEKKFRFTLCKRVSYVRYEL